MCSQTLVHVSFSFIVHKCSLFSFFAIGEQFCEKKKSKKEKMEEQVNQEQVNQEQVNLNEIGNIEKNAEQEKEQEKETKLEEEEESEEEKEEEFAPSESEGVLRLPMLLPK
jgi:hypothetical protein